MAKTIHDTSLAPAKADLFEMGQQLEQAGKLEKAVAYYERQVKRHPLSEASYKRLMIIYRKLKQPTKELTVIDDAIKAFTARNKTSAAGKNTQIVRLSKQLNILVGLTDKKGNALHDPEPIATWKKRKALLQQRMKKNRKR